MTIYELKKEQRKLALSNRRRLDPAEYSQKCRQIEENIKKIIENREIKKVFSYCALKDEVNLDSINQWLCSNDMKVSYPVTYGNGIMDAVNPSSEKWEQDCYGIRIPSRGEKIDPEELDLVLAPCVAFDRSGNRLGYGKGYYDRYLQYCRSALKIAVAFSCQEVESIATEPTDMKLDIIITEKEIITTGA